MKRFWDEVSVAADERANAWCVQLDGKPVRVPGGGLLRLETRALADAVAAEWRAAGGAHQDRENAESGIIDGAKGGELSYADLPLTRLAGTAQERIAPDPIPVVLELARYAESDLLCYRAERPAELVRRQEEFWQPWLDWAATDLGAPLRVTAGIVHVPQDRRSLLALQGIVAVQSPACLAALGVMVPSFGSLVLGLAVATLRIDAGEALRVASIDESFQAEIWGEDDEAAARRQAIAEDVAVAGRFLVLSRARGAGLPTATMEGPDLEDGA
jgi:chaperone required for assembly of F1-ATPase